MAWGVGNPRDRFCANRGSFGCLRFEDGPH